jgi:hypothetical protein
MRVRHLIASGGLLIATVPLSSTQAQAKPATTNFKNEGESARSAPVRKLVAHVLPILPIT